MVRNGRVKVVKVSADAAVALKEALRKSAPRRRFQHAAFFFFLSGFLFLCQDGLFQAASCRQLYDLYLVVSVLLPITSHGLS